MKTCVITGGPSSGKTSVIDELRRRGYKVVDETAREVILEGKFNDNYENLQIEIFKRQIKKEEHHKKHAAEELFFDRSATDVIAYYTYKSLKVPKELEDFDFSARYDFVFILDLLPFKNDKVRLEKDDKEAKLIHDHLMMAYKKHGYNTINVPKMSVKERVDFILNKIKNH